MNKIVEKKHFSEKVVQLVVEAPLIARSRRAGHFVIVRADEHGERIPLTIADSDTTAGTITLVVQAVGKSTKKICDKAVGDSLHDVVGPLGQATKIEKVGTVVCCGGGVGVAPLLPIIRAMKQAGNRVVSVLADQVVTIGPAVMMKFVALLTKKYDIPTVCSLNTIMVDGTGMCGACRVTVGGRTRFVCIDGPEFDAHQVDFDQMMMRLHAYDNENKN